MLDQVLGLYKINVTLAKGDLHLECKFDLYRLKKAHTEWQPFPLAHIKLLLVNICVSQNYYIYRGVDFQHRSTEKHK